MPKKYDYDVIVIWAGSWGLTTSIWLANAGKKVALIEKWLIWGDCTNVWCVPSKAFLDITRKMHPFLHETEAFSQWGDFGEKVQFIKKQSGWSSDIGITPLQYALQETRSRRQVIQDEETPEALMEHYPFDIIQWKGVFQDEHTVEVKDQAITGKKVVIATWGHARELEIPWANKDKVITNEQVFEIEGDIQNLVIVWGGYIGCEMAEAFAHAWVKVTIVHRWERILSREEPESSDVITKHFRDLGIRVMTEANIVSANSDSVSISQEDEDMEVSYDYILTTIGRIPNTSWLGLDEAGILHDKKGIIVDKYSRTNKKNVFAIGDCVSWNPQFTHWANNEGRAVVRNILVPFFKATNRNAHLPANLYTSLEIWRVWLTQVWAEEQYGEDGIVTQIVPFSDNDRSKVTDDEAWFVKVIFKRISWRILGASVVGTWAWEVLSTITSYIENNVKASKISKQVFAYPTKWEAIKQAADAQVFHTLWNAKKEAKWWFFENLFQIIGALIWITILVAFFTYKNMHGLSFAEMSKSLYFFIREHPWGAFVYIFIYAIRPMTFFPATFLTFISWVLYGPLWGFVYTMIGENLSANFAYWLGKGMGNRLIRWNTGLLWDLQTRLEKSSFMPILFTRLAFFPFDLVNYASGILRASWSGFALATLVGIIPWALVFILVGASISEITPSTDLTELIASVDIKWLYIALGIFIVSVVLAKVLNRKEA